MTRFAIYIAPRPDSLWSVQASRWLGCDAMNGHTLPQIKIPGIPPERLRQLTQDAAYYGFHATLKAPFVLLDSASENDLTQMAKAFSAEQAVIQVQDLRAQQIANSLALCPMHSNDEINTLAMRCVRYFDPLRAPPDAAYLAKRRRTGLSERQEVLLQRWGYPYTEEEFRFHITLSSSLKNCDHPTIAQLQQAAENHFLHTLNNAPFIIDALCIFKQEVSDKPFICWRRFPFQ
jgi:ribose 1,5-bisphosphokinase